MLEAPGAAETQQSDGARKGRLVQVRVEGETGCLQARSTRVGLDGGHSRWQNRMWN